MAPMINQMDLPPEAKTQMTQMLSSGLMTVLVGGASLFSIVLVPIFFLISVGIYYLVARALGGSGDYGRYAYLVATYQAPISIILAVVSIIPLLGSCVSVIGWIYGLVLTYYATKVEHNLTSGKAIAVIVIPVLIVFAFFACIFIAFAGIFAALMKNQ